MLPDLRYALRLIRQNPWFSAAIIGTLALGIGVNTTVFTLVNAVLFKPLPVPGGDRIVMAPATRAADGRNTVNVSYPDLRDFRQAATAFERLEAFAARPVTLSENGNPPERYAGARVTSGMFEMLHIPPVLGRALNADDERPGAEPVILLGHGVWKDRYGMRPDVIGRTVRANEKPAVIIGVMPEGLAFPSNEALWMNIAPDAEWEKRENRSLMMVGLLKPGQTRAAAQAQLAVVAQRLEKQFPESHQGHGIAVRTFHEVMNGGPIRLIFLLLLGAVGFVLLIACANVANMLLGRALVRRREMSIRVTMGAGRWRVVRQLLVESVLLSVIGGAIGLLLAQFAVNAFALAVSDVGKPYWILFEMDYVVFAYFAAICLFAGVLFGLAPALQATRLDLSEALKEGAKSSASGRTGYLSAGLVVLQFTLAVVLLSAAGLMIRSFLKAQDEYAALPMDQILTVRVNLPDARYPKPEQRRRFFDQALSGLSNLPGAQQVSMTSSVPGNGYSDERFELAGQPEVEHERRPQAGMIVVSPGYFPLLGARPVQGRDFQPTDGLPGQEAILVGREFVTRYSPRENPVGRKIRFFDEAKKPKPWMTIVGVIPDVSQSNGPGDAEPRPLVALPYNGEPYRGMAFLLRTSGSPTALTAAVRREFQKMDGELPLFDARTLNASIERGRWHFRVFGTLFLVFALIALGIAAVGVYAVIAHATAQRTREIGVRLALGASGGTIVRMVLNRGLAQVGAGMVIGLTAAYFVCRLMASLLFKVSPSDPVTFGIVGVTLFAAGLAACWLPARRASRLDPMVALRYE